MRWESWLQLHPQMAFLVVFVTCFLEFSFIIGVFLPSLVILTSISLLCGRGILATYPILAVAITGAWCGCQFSFFLGRQWQSKIRTLSFFQRWPNILMKAEQLLAQHAFSAVFLGQFLSPMRAVISTVAGSCGIKWPIFGLSSLVACSAYILVFSLPGWMLGQGLNQISVKVMIHLVIFVLVFGVLFWLICQILLLLYQWLTRKAAHALARTMAPMEPMQWPNLKRWYYIGLSLFLFMVLKLANMFLDPSNISWNLWIWQSFQLISNSHFWRHVFLLIEQCSSINLLTCWLALFLVYAIYHKQWLLSIQIAALGIGNLMGYYALIIPKPLVSFHHLFNKWPSLQIMLTVAWTTSLWLMGERHQLINVMMWLFPMLVGISQLYFQLEWFSNILSAWLVAIAVSQAILIIQRSPYQPSFSKIRLIGLVLAFFLLASLVNLHTSKITSIKSQLICQQPSQLDTENIHLTISDRSTEWQTEWEQHGWIKRDHGFQQWLKALEGKQTLENALVIPKALQPGWPEWVFLYMIPGSTRGLIAEFWHQPEKHQWISVVSEYKVRTLFWLITIGQPSHRHPAAFWYSTLPVIDHMTLTQVSSQHQSSYCRKKPADKKYFDSKVTASQ